VYARSATSRVAVASETGVVEGSTAIALARAYYVLAGLIYQDGCGGSGFFEVLPLEGIEDQVREHLATDVKVTDPASPRNLRRTAATQRASCGRKLNTKATTYVANVLSFLRWPLRAEAPAAARRGRWRPGQPGAHEF
jgi:hypothetical protein